MRDSDIDTLTADGAQDGANTTNEAAERLRTFLRAGGPDVAPFRTAFDDALAAERRAVGQEYEQRILTLRETADRATARADAERRATVERIVQRWHDAEQYREGGSHPNSTIRGCGICSAVLDEEAAR
jgi:GrpB-like predicted nucleotidyltransferase (UPF0157 family)